MFKTKLQMKKFLSFAAVILGIFCISGCSGNNSGSTAAETVASNSTVTESLKHPVKVLVLCTGNTCRSQMAHGFFSSFDKNLQVYSGGVEPAEKINPKAVEVMAELGIDISDHTPHDVREYLDESWDYVITVCDHAHETCPVFNGEVVSQMHIGFDDPSRATGTPEFIDSEYHRVRDEIGKRMRALYEFMLTDQNNK